MLPDFIVDISKHYIFQANSHSRPLVRRYAPTITTLSRATILGGHIAIDDVFSPLGRHDGVAQAHMLISSRARVTRDGCGAGYSRRSG